MGSPPQGDMATQLGAQDWAIKSGSGVLNLYNGAYRVLYFDTSGAITFLPSQGGSFPTANLTVAEGADLHGYINSRLGTPLEINTVNGDNVLLGGQVGKYRNITTFGYGVPAVFGNARSTGQT